jgi:hypothetical protein
MGGSSARDKYSGMQQTLIQLCDTIQFSELPLYNLYCKHLLQATLIAVRAAVTL